MSGKLKCGVAAGWLVLSVSATSAFAASFDSWDTNKNTNLSAEEFRAGLEHSGLFTQWDTNNDGSLTKDELNAGLGEGSTDYSVRFGAWDRNKNNSLSGDELYDGILTSHDYNADNVLEEQEFSEFNEMIGSRGIAGLAVPDETNNQSNWQHEALYTGISADWLIDRDVYGQNGNHVGEVHNIFVSPDGTIHSIVVEGGGFLDIGDQHFKVPWNQVRITGDGNVLTPVREENVNEFSLFEGEEVTTPQLDGQRAFRVTELLDDIVRSRNGYNIGYVDDLIFSRDGKLQAVVMQPNARYLAPGYYATPFYGYPYGWRPGYNYYALPVGEGDLQRLGGFDYERVNPSQDEGSVSQRTTEPNQAERQ